MKKIYKYALLLLLSLGAVTGWTAEYSMDPDYIPISNKEPSKKVSVGDGYVLPGLLQGKPLKIALWVENEKKGQFEKFADMTKQVYQEWFDNAVYFIERSAREPEFQDVLPYLRKELPIEVVRYDENEPADLKVFVHATLKSMDQFLYEEEGKEKGEVFGLYSKEKKRMNITKQSSLAKPKYVLQYLSGFSLGFAGQDYCERSYGDPVFTSDSAYNVMNNSPKLTCDDADGIINLIDSTLRLRRGGESGWRSLCDWSSQYYLGGMPTNTNRYRSKQVAEDYLVVEEYENGKKIDTLEFKFTKDIVNPFAFVEEETVVKRDSAGYPALVKGKNGELVYYIRIYERVEKIITKNGEMLAYMYTYPVSGAHLGIIKKFPVDGKVGWLKGKMTFKQRPLSASYNYPDGEKRLTLEYFTSKGKVVAQEGYRGDWYILHRADPVLIRPYESSLVSSLKGIPTENIEEKMKETIIRQGLFEWGQEWPEHLESALE